MSEPHPVIEIFKPFEEAFELMKKILFRPFDFSKWCVLGFAAFLAGHFGGGGISRSFGNNSANHSFSRHGFDSMHQYWSWFVALLVVVSLFVLLLIVVWSWIRARGIFIFTDCIVRDRAAIKEPWREYRREGNSYFLFCLAVMFGVLVVVATLVGMGVLCVWAIHIPKEARTITFIVGGVLLFFAWICLTLCFALVNYFIPVVMYIRRSRALDALREVVSLMRANASSFLLFGLFSLVLLLGLMVVGTIVTCATCCLAALPYVGTVILLPALVWLRAFGLLFFRQFGPDYDVWRRVPQLPSTPPLPPRPF